MQTFEYKHTWDFVHKNDPTIQCFLTITSGAISCYALGAQITPPPLFLVFVFENEGGCIFYLIIAPAGP